MSTTVILIIHMYFSNIIKKLEDYLLLSNLKYVSVECSMDPKTNSHCVVIENKIIVLLLGKVDRLYHIKIYKIFDPNVNFMDKSNLLSLHKISANCELESLLQIYYEINYEDKFGQLIKISNKQFERITEVLFNECF